MRKLSNCARVALAIALKAVAAHWAERRVDFG
jgi:hypothetical protein